MRGPVENHGDIGERLDADAGLLFLNARYMDPQLGMFIQPDWWEVTKPGVGTNRYAYAGGDPVNGIDPGGNSCGTFGPFTATANCTGSFWHDLGASALNAVTSDLGNMLSSPFVAIGSVTAPHEGAITNFVMTTPIPEDDLAWAPFRASSYLYLRSVEKISPIESQLHSSVTTSKNFSVGFETKLKSTSYPGVSREKHFQESNESLLSVMEADPSFAQDMANLGVNLQRTPTGLAPRSSPKDWTWHHAETPGTMQLVPRVQHAPGSMFQHVLHPGNKGGFAIWGRQ